jgi:hypothetical protein
VFCNMCTVLPFLKEIFEMFLFKCRRSPVTIHYSFSVSTDI